MAESRVARPKKEAAEKKAEAATAAGDEGMAKALAWARAECKKITKGLDTNLLDDSGGYEEAPCISTSHPFLDWVCGAEMVSSAFPAGRAGGIFLGRHIEISGFPSGGKSLLAMLQAIQFQRRNLLTGYVLWIDAEHCFVPEYFKSLGGDLSRIIVHQPTSGQEAIRIIGLYVTQKLVDLVVVDSVSALVPENELEGDLGDAQTSGLARLMSPAMRQLNGLMAESLCSIIWINQLRVKLNFKGPSTTTTTGGNALTFFSSLRLHVTRKEKIEVKRLDPFSGKEVDELVGIVSEVRCDKNKHGTPYRSKNITFMLGRGYDYDADLLSACADRGFITHGGGWYKAEKYGFDTNMRAFDLRVLLAENAELRNKMWHDIMQAVVVDDGSKRLPISQAPSLLEAAAVK